ncbi:protein-tyrosine-phosphatase [Actinomadura pelletieri DSM 43383]|uniref:Protein-tyrosine-phosphatase n=1 Tax=Actinomadura pelletieri DSM 43383 TaxID=1120940 RepID=A0A495QHM6_9ACTN|nr:helix-turn-helix domain-containing protein [Actinomadura pelletieri]RKS71643.1 protein-tyrosine-phosphatase [Actinomadura pelletieri DSM 43383]
MAIDPSSLRGRAAAHHALGDPARLAIVEALMIGDVAPGELGRTLGMPSNLLAHHLGVLQDAGLVGRTRSEADRRRTYVRLIPAALRALNPIAPLTVPRVVFVCTRNGARSPLAAALWADRSTIPVASAGIDPAPRVHPRAVSTAHRHGLRLQSHDTAHVDDVLTPTDLLVAVCDNAYRHLGPAPRRAHWSVPDPGPVDTEEIFEEVFGQLAERIEWLSSITTPPGSGTAV